MAMTGKTYVDGVDIYKAYGVYVTSGGWNSLVAMPPLKAPESNDWQEEDGVEEDLSAPVLDTKEVTVSFACGSSATRLFDFIAALSDGAYHEFDCAWIGRTYRLRLVSQPKMSYNPALGTFSLKLADDFPPPFTDAGPSGGVDAHGDYLLDGTDVAAYGVRVLSGTLSRVLATPDVKPALLRNIAGEEGAEYDGGDGARVTFRSKDVKLSCLMRAATLEGLWANWDALLRDLTLPGTRDLYVEAAARTFSCRYKSCSVSSFDPGRGWLQFSLTLSFTGDQRIFTGDWLLSSEDGAFVTTEDGEDRIDMRPVSAAEGYGASRVAAVSGLSVEAYADTAEDGSGIRKVKVSELTACSDLTGLWTLGTDSANDSVKVSLEFVGEAAENANKAADRANKAAEDADLTNYYTKSETDSLLRGYATTTDFDSAVSDLQKQIDGLEAGDADLTNYYTKSETDSLLRGYTTTTDFDSAVSDLQKQIDGLEAGDGFMARITEEEIDALLTGFVAFNISAEGEEPLALVAEGTEEGVRIAGSVDISGIPEDDIRAAFGE